MTKQVKISTGSSRVTVLVDGATTIAKVLDDNKIPTEGCTVSVNSVPCMDLSRTLDQCTSEESVFLTAVVNTKNA